MSKPNLVAGISRGPFSDTIWHYTCQILVSTWLCCLSQPHTAMPLGAFQENFVNLCLLNPSPPVLISIRQSKNVQSFDPSGSTLFYMQKKEEVDLKSRKMKKKSLLWLRASYLYRKIVLSDPVGDEV